jgi:integrase
MDRPRREGGIDAALAAEVKKHRGVEIHGASLRIWFMWGGVRCRETLGLEVTRANIKHASQLRSAVQHAIKTGTFDYSKFFPNSAKARDSALVRSIRLADAKDKYFKLKLTDITEGTERRYTHALDVCVAIVGADLLVNTIMPEDIQQMRADLITTRKVSTVNHYLSTFAGMLNWCKENGYTDRDLAAGCRKFSKTDGQPDPLSNDEFRQVISSGCLHPQDVALVTLAVYTGLRPGELCALAREDIDLTRMQISVRRSITDTGTLKVTKTGKDRIVWLMPPALEAVKTLLHLTKGNTPQPEEIEITRHERRTENITPLVDPATQARNHQQHRWMRTTTWSTKWDKLLKRAKVRHRRCYQTRHTFACWSLTAHGNLAYIANQMGHKDYSMLVNVYAAWMDSESKNESEFIWSEMQKKGAFAPMVPQEKRDPGASD